MNAVLCGAGQNMRKLMREVRGCPDFFILFFKEVYFSIKKGFISNRRIEIGLKLKKGCQFLSPVFSLGDFFTGA